MEAFGQVYADGNVVGQIEIPDLAGEPQFRVEDASTGQRLTLSLGQIRSLTNIARTLGNESATFVERSRFEAYHPTTTPTLTEQLVVHNRAILWDLPATLRAADLDTADFLPIMVWNRSADQPCWRLTLAGADTVTVATARWDDREAIASLVEALHDPEGVKIMAGIIDAAPVARLSARVTAARLRASRSLPSITLKPVRAMLTNAGLECADSEYRGYRALMRVMTVQVSAERKIPVAVCIQAPRTHRAFYTAPTDADLAGLSRDDQRAVQQVREDTASDAWLETARNVLTTGGWRLLDLPAPRQGWHYYGSSRRTRPCLWVTRIDAETWSGIAAAAEAAAPNLEMNRGAAL